MNIDKKTVLHVSKLCKIDIENDLDKYYKEFEAIMDSVNEILEVEVKEEFMVVPNQQKNRYFSASDLRISSEEFFVDSKRGFKVFKRCSK